MSIFRRFISFDPGQSEHDAATRIDTVVSLACKLNNLQTGAGPLLGAQEKAPILCGARYRDEPYGMCEKKSWHEGGFAQGPWVGHVTFACTPVSGTGLGSVYHSTPMGVVAGDTQQERQGDKADGSEIGWVKKALQKGTTKKPQKKAGAKRKRNAETAGGEEQEKTLRGDEDSPLCDEASTDDDFTGPTLGDEEPAFGDCLEDFEEADEAELDEQDEYKDWDELGKEMGYAKKGKKKKKHRNSKTRKRKKEKAQEEM